MNKTSENQLPPATRRARELVLRFGWNATAYQLINHGIAYWFSEHGDAVVGFVEKAGACVVAGAPVSAEDRLPAILQEWEEFCRARKKRICYFGAAGRINDLLGAAAEYSTVVFLSLCKTGAPWRF